MNSPEDFDENTVKPVVRRRRAQSEASTESTESTEPGESAGPLTAPPDRGPDQARTDAPRRTPSQSSAAGPQRSSDSLPPQQPAPRSPDQERRQRPAGQRRPDQRPTDQRPSQGRPPQGQRTAARPQRPASATQRGDGTRPPGRPPTDRTERREPQGEYVQLPASTYAARRLLAFGGLCLLVVGLVVGIVFVWGSRQINPSGEQGAVVESFEVPRGASSDTIGSLLADEGIISSARLFRYYVSWKNAGPWEAGTYVDLRQNSSFDEAIAVLDEGPVPAASNVVRVTEGTRLSDALVRIAEQVPTVTVEQLQQTLDSGQVTSKYKPADVTSWEGLLFPDTYQFGEAATAQEILQAMATKMDNVLDELGYDRAEALQGRSAYELITIASLIEKETGAPEEERAKISRVISNRLDRNETLGIDATILYGLDRTAGELTKADLERETPYNSRKVKGLPPTPIALPGEASLAAAIEPAEGKWTFYVLTSNDPPSHFFTDDYDEFLAAKKDAQERGVF